MNIFRSMFASYRPPRQAQHFLLKAIRSASSTAKFMFDFLAVEKR